MRAQGTVRLKTAIPGPLSIALTERRRAAVARGVAEGVPIFVDGSLGATVTDVDGNVLLDFAGGIGVLNAGSCPPEVVAAIKYQAERLLHSCFVVDSYAGYVQLAEALIRITPGTFPKKAILVNSGAEAVENAVKIARHHTGRRGVVVFGHAFHGRTALAMTMTAKHAPYKKGFGGGVPDIHRVPFPYPYRGVSSGAALTAFRAALTDQIGPESIAAVVLELVAGEGGFLPAPAEFVHGVRETCAEHGIVFVADEIQTGFARTGRMFAAEHFGVEPDLVLIAKSIASGLPLAAVVGRAEIMDSPGPGGLGSTFGGNPLACAAALATIELMERDDLPGRAERLGRRLEERFHRWWEQYPLVGEARGLGAMRAIELVRDRGTREPAAAETDRVYRLCYERGLILIKAGTYDNVIRFLAPLTISDEELEEGLEILERALAEVSG